MNAKSKIIIIVLVIFILASSGCIGNELSRREQKIVDRTKFTIQTYDQRPASNGYDGPSYGVSTAGVRETGPFIPDATFSSSEGFRLRRGWGAYRTSPYFSGISLDVMEFAARHNMYVPAGAEVGFYYVPRLDDANPGRPVRAIGIEYQTNYNNREMLFVVETDKGASWSHDVYGPSTNQRVYLEFDQPADEVRLILRQHASGDVRSDWHAHIYTVYVKYA